MAGELAALVVAPAALAPFQFERRWQLRLKPVAVAPEVERPQPVSRLPDEVPLADQDLVRIPPERLAFGAVAPPDRRPTRPQLSTIKILELEDLCYERLCWTGGHHDLCGEGSQFDRRSSRFSVDRGSRHTSIGISSCSSAWRM